MKIFNLNIFIFLLLATTTHAQNWQTINCNSTGYFTSNKILKYIELKSCQQNSNGDSIFNFFNTQREAGIAPSGLICVDTFGASWLGAFMLKKNNDSTELYFNYKGDTITIQPQASLGTSWQLAQLDTNVIVTATVVSIDTTTLNGAIDSIKKIELSATKNGVPLPSFFYALLISKNNGWVQLPDWYCFNATSLQDVWYDNAVNSNDTYVRIDTPKAQRLRSGIDVHKKFQTGNEWIYYMQLPTTLDYRQYKHDSIISSTPAGSSSYLCTIRRRSLMYWRNPMNAYAPETIWKDTIFTSICDSNFHCVEFLAGTPLMHEAITTPTLHPENYYKARYTIYSLDTAVAFQQPIVSSEENYNNEISNSPPCPAFLFNISGARAIINAKINNVAGILYYNFHYPAMTSSYPPSHNFELLYAKFGTETYGQQMHLAANAINNVSALSPSSITPNPCSNIAYISGANTQGATIAVYNIFGKIILPPTIMTNTSFDCSLLTSGLYFLELRKNNITQRVKFLKE